jgi:hypothetical protein
VVRYFVIATVLVVGIAVAATAWVHRDLIRIRIGSVQASAPPKPAAPDAWGTRPNVPFRGVAPWALSALPECFRELFESRGTQRYVAAHLPHDLRRVLPPATVRSGDCTIDLTGDAATVIRGDDRFFIPPHVRLYAGGDRIALVRSSGEGSVLRVYERTSVFPSTERSP